MAQARGASRIAKSSLRHKMRVIRAKAAAAHNAQHQADEALARVLIAWLNELAERRAEDAHAEELRPSYLAGRYDEPEHLRVQATLGTLWRWNPTNNRTLAAQLSPTYTPRQAREIAERIRATRWPNVAPDVLARLKAEAAAREAEEAAAREAQALGGAEATAETPVLRVACYAALGSELSLAPFARAVADGLADGTRVALYAPMVLGPNHLEFVEVSAEELADPAASGLSFLMRPAERTRPLAERPFEPCTNLDVVLVPGLAFGEDGARLGYGGGYYDAFLALYTAQQRWAGQDMGSWPQPRPAGAGSVIGIAYAEQLLAAGAIPMGYNDQPIGRLATPSGIVELSA